ncbi:Lpg1974 family pore-forming outer membrane protein [Legionella worsleiensis]|uniref:Major outer membrane protein n=1 Tax=Legionella worsleiensis TaxID=45076 RepID=A0A0W1AE99_9GAMM|nr:Lpg1974 family pore-forming outer membrane protein [Legionella worsleiensis]KTD79653.1 major outer membrane protein [Legionella worsleiensis]STY32163.1 major outer membrane protein [Legionella worsleiensis]
MNTRFLILAILQFLCVSVFAGDMGSAKEGHPINVYVPELKSGFEVTASATYLQPLADNFGWAVITTVLPIPSPNWRVQTIQPDYQLGFNLGARYVFSTPGTDVQLNWSHLESRDQDGVIVNPTSQWVSPFSQTGTPPTTTGQITGVSLLKKAEAQLNFNYDAINLDVGKFINFGSSLQTRLFTGISSVFIKEQLVSTFRGLSLPIFVFDNTSSYQGIGPRLGLSNDYEFYRGVHLVGQLAGSLLFGRMQPAQYQFTGTSAELIAARIYVNREGLANPTVDQMVTAVDAKLGLSYLYQYDQKADITFEAGYMGALYINPLASYETNTNVIPIDSGSLSTSSAKHTQSNFSAGGPYLTVKLRC